MTWRLFPSKSPMLAAACALLAATAVPTLGLASSSSSSAAAPFRPAAEQTAALEPPPVEAGPLSYRGAWGGLHVADMTLTLRGDEEAYQGDLVIATRGLLGWAFDWVGALHSRGDVGEAGDLRPLSFSRRFTEADGSGEVVIEYDSSGVAQGYEDGRPQNAVAPHLRRGTVDPLAALLALRQEVLAGRRGPKVMAVYDGKRRMDIRADIAAPRTTRLGGGDRAVVPVRAEIAPVAGFKPKQARGWAGSHLTVLFSDDGRAVPLRIDIESPVGTAVLTLR